MLNLKRFYLPGVFSLLALVCSVSPVAADGPWKWQFSLNVIKDKQPNQMLLPTALYIDRERERYYVVDAVSNSLHSFDMLGGHLNSLKPGDQLKQPYGMVRDSKELLWVVEKGRNTLTEIDLKEKKIVPHQLKWGTREIYPDRIALSGGDFYVLDKISGGVLKLDAKLQVVQEFVNPGAQGGIVDFTFSNGSLWTIDTLGKMIYVFSQSGEIQRKIALGDAVSFPYAIAIGPGGQIYVLDRHAGAVAVFDDSGLYKYKFLTKGQARGRLYYPEDIQFDFLGRLCVVDSGNGRVEIFAR